ncbi:PREDICTED: odorant receptor 82a-like isoform X2 [Vollenhovia emeryi]|uniref:odorant receptor 82a-like isoform X2 n=1 Tax=Vollenhovia emeryi TaxID=411798 RepID=UPI0005F453C5|nr:PREDICTED: odorant receptor 82a-like isoform X2 [Vollenhovia emeryi]XP_011862404.1 PREDICTED: odorant receptor 82a-like isoform X2 [Vollenhovia emeryi]
MKRPSTISRPVEIGLRFIGMWPDSAYATLYWLIYMATMVIVQYYQYAYVLAHFDLSDIPLLMDCLGLTLAYTLAFFKLFALWWNRRTFYYIVKTMDRDWKECVINDSYQSTMMSVADLSRRCTNVMISINALAAFFLSIGEHLLQSMGNAAKVDNYSRELPIKMEFPFDVSESPTFECFLIGQFFYELVLASIVGMMNALLVSLILHVSGQIDIMRQDIDEISNSKNDPSTSLVVIKSLICKHQKIIILSENIENLYTYIALMQLLWNTLVICCTGFVIIITLGTNDSGTTSIKSVSFYLAITLEVFILCFAGEFLSAKSRSISDAIYESLWYNMPPTNSRILMFVILRSQKRLTITAGKVVDLTLEGFTSIMKASASYVSVLNAMY